MSEVKHTPGPWEYLSETIYLYDQPYGVSHVVVRIVDKTFTICSHNSDYSDTKEMEANARLIAAAPDLLEALENYVHAAFETGESHGHNPVDPDGELLSVMKKVISKAKG